MTQELPITERSRLRRAPARGHYDRQTIYDILDAQPMCSFGYLLGGMPQVTPSLQWREGNRVYWHGSSASRALRAAKDTDVCLSVAILDGYVLARSGMNHSLNTRSVTLYGKAQKVEDPEEKLRKLGKFVNGLFPGRYETLRPDHVQDLKATMVLGMEIAEGSAKIRTGGPKDEEADYDLPIWAGVIPVSISIGKPIPDPRNHPEVRVPDHVRGFEGRYTGPMD